MRRWWSLGLRRCLRVNRRRRACFPFRWWRWANQGLNRLTHRRFRPNRGLNLFAHRKLNSVTHRGLWAHWRLNLLANRRLNLLMNSRRILRASRHGGFIARILACGLCQTRPWFGRSLGKGRRCARAHGGRNGMDLLRVDPLNLAASGRRVLASRLRAQGLQLRRGDRGSRMRLQHLLPGGKRNRSLRWSKFGDDGTIRYCSGRSGSGTATGICQHALPLWRYFGSCPNNLGIANLGGVNTNAGMLNRLCRSKGILRHCHHCIAIRIGNVRNVDVRHIDVGDAQVGDAGIGDVHPADIIL